MKPIPGFSDAATVELVAKVRDAVAAGCGDVDAVAAAVGVDRGVAAAALARLRDGGELAVDAAARSWRLVGGVG